MPAVKPIVILVLLVFVALTVGGNARAVTATPSFTFVAIQSNGPGSDDSAVLWVVNQDGSGPRRLTDPFPCIDCADSPRFSPDGTTIAFSGSDFQRSDVESIGVDGSNLRPAACKQCSDSPAWSPDGTRIAAGANGGTIVVSDYPSGSHRRVVVRGYNGNSGFDWSRDGKQFAYPDAMGRLHMISDNGRGGEELTQNAQSPRFSPDGRAILFVDQQARFVYLIPRGGGRAKRIAAGNSAAWSGNGKQIAVMNGGPTITILDVVSGRTQRLRLPQGLCTGRGGKYCVRLDWHT